MRIAFIKQPGGSCVARLTRRDGVVVELPSYSRTHRVPHDLAHFAAERGFTLTTGVFGSLAAGGLFDNARVVGGRPRPDAAARSQRILRANRAGLGVAEVLAGVLHHTVEHDITGTPFAKARHDWGIVEQRPFPYPESVVADATWMLRDLASRWAALQVEEVLDELWPDALTSPVPRPGR